MSSKTSPQAIIFDLDGTIIDSEKPAIDIAKLVLPRFGRAVTKEDLSYLKGKAWYNIMMEWFPENGQAVYNDIIAEWDRLNPALPAYDGVIDAISRLHKFGARMGIASSKQTYYIMKDLEDLGIDPFFESVVGQDDTIRHKPNPDPLILAAKKLGVHPSECIYIGDQPTDIMASRSAGMKSGGALWGEGEFEVLSKSNPDYLFRLPSDVVNSFFTAGASD